jgi:K+-transporting ATPase ATPase A chain
MTGSALLQLVILFAALAVATPLLGSYLAKVYSDDGRRPADRVFGPIERLAFRICGVDPKREQRWSMYAVSVLAFSAVSLIGLYLLQRVQGGLPLNPDGHGSVNPWTAWNTAVSFVTNTNWQSYAGESTMSHLTQMAGLAVQNFVSAAVGISVAIALIRGLTRSRSETLGNFWADLIRTVLRVLLPIAIVGAIVLAGSGVIQNLSGSTTVTTLEGATQHLPGGPVASQEVIKALGTNGGGFFNANSAHPFENPNGFTNLFQIFLILLIPFALTFAYGRLVKDRRQGYVVTAAMAILLIGSLAVGTWSETRTAPQLDKAGVSQVVVDGHAAGPMEGKEVRTGTAGCAAYVTATTSTSTGAVNCAHDSLSPAAGGLAMFNMMLGEISPGGVGSGLYGMLIFILTAVFIAGLMVGRTPEYLGKRIQAGEMKLVVLYILFVPMVVLGFAAIAVATRSGLNARLNGGPHGLSEIVYAYTSTGNNNGSAFGGLTVTSSWFQITLGLAMLIGRFLPMVAALGVAGSLARKPRIEANAGTFPTGTPLFTFLLVGVVVIVVGLTFFPVLALGPVVEHLAMAR